MHNLESMGARALIAAPQAGRQALPTKAPISRLQAGGGADLHLDAAQDLPNTHTHVSAAALDHAKTHGGVSELDQRRGVRGRERAPLHGDAPRSDKSAAVGPVHARAHITAASRRWIDRYVLVLPDGLLEEAAVKFERVDAAEGVSVDGHWRSLVERSQRGYPQRTDRGTVELEGTNTLPAALISTRMDRFHRVG
jgi:hypothetical protein